MGLMDELRKLARPYEDEDEEYDEELEDTAEDEEEAEAPAEPAAASAGRAARRQLPSARRPGRPVRAPAPIPPAAAMSRPPAGATRWSTSTPPPSCRSCW